MTGSIWFDLSIFLIGGIFTAEMGRVGSKEGPNSYEFTSYLYAIAVLLWPVVWLIVFWKLIKGMFIR